MRRFLVFLFGGILAAQSIPPITFAPTSLSFSYQIGQFIPDAQGIVIASPDHGGSFTASRPIDQTWLAFLSNDAGQLVGSIPAYVQLYVRPQGLGPGKYTTQVTIRTPSGTQTIPVNLQVSSAPVLLTVPGQVAFDLLTFAGIPNPAGTVQVGSTNPVVPVLLSAASTTPWITARATGSTVQVGIDRSKLPPGVVSSSFTASANGFFNSPLSVPVVVLENGLDSRGALTLSPNSLDFNGSGSKILAVNAAAATNLSASTSASWLSVSPSGGATPQALTVCADGAGMSPGNYQGTVSLTANGAIQTVPVNFTALGPAAPNITRVVNAATFQDGPISPGMIVTLGGTAIGPPCLKGLALGPDGKVSTDLQGTQVLFNGVAAPMVYASGGQVSAVVPYEVDGRNTADIQVVLNGQASNTLSAPVTAAAPGIFTANSSGSGPGAILNVDNSLNSPSNPAARGAAVVLYLTGEGQTGPAGVTGKVTEVAQNPPLTPEPKLPVTVQIDGKPAHVIFAGEAPGFVSGVLQVNAEIPADSRSGEVPIRVTVGSSTSPDGVTVSVR